MMDGREKRFAKSEYPEILPEVLEPCQWCAGMAVWERIWAQDGDMLLFSYLCPVCGHQTIAEYPALEKPSLRRGLRQVVVLK